MTTKSDDDQHEHFFETLSGHTKKHTGAKAMRDAVRDEIETEAEAEAAEEASLTDKERAAMRNVKARMMHEGAWPVETLNLRTVAKPATNESSSPIASFGRWLHDQISGGAWKGAAGLALIVVLGSMVVLKGMLPGESELPMPTDVVRGDEDPAIEVDAPLEEAEGLAAKLRALGAQVAVIPINDAKTVVEVDVETTKVSGDVHNLLTNQGFDAPMTNHYRLEFNLKKK